MKTFYKYSHLSLAICLLFTSCAEKKQEVEVALEEEQEKVLTPTERLKQIIPEELIEDMPREEQLTARLNNVSSSYYNSDRIVEKMLALDEKLSVEEKARAYLKADNERMDRTIALLEKLNQMELSKEEYAAQAEAFQKRLKEMDEHYEEFTRGIEVLDEPFVLDWIMKLSRTEDIGYSEKSKKMKEALRKFDPKYLHKN